MFFEMAAASDLAGIAWKFNEYHDLITILFERSQARK